jgi:hypothetical protein
LANGAVTCPSKARDGSPDAGAGPPEGLATVEGEADDEASLSAWVAPDWALREITHLPQWPCDAPAAQFPED